MPIKPENKDLYPRDWQAIRARVLVRAQNCCEWDGGKDDVPCGLENYSRGARDKNGYWWWAETIPMLTSEDRMRIFGTDSPKIIRIILTVAHLDHDPTNNRMENLAALCQLHHNRYDAGHRVETRRATLAQRFKQSQDVVSLATQAHNPEGWAQVEMDLPLGSQDGAEEVTE